MPVVNRMAELKDEIAAWRHDLHAHPELLYDVHRTAAFVAARLRDFGCDEVVEGIGRTGVVGVIHGAKTAPVAPRLGVVGLRADMDALPIEEATDAPYRSRNPGKMHACGHDGHTAMLLGAAKHLAQTRNFAGSVAVIFQPAEEGGAGAKAMIDDALMTRFGIDEVYGMHNFPGLPIGQFALRAGAMMASTDHLVIDIEGVGGHAARPHRTVDPVMIGAQMISQIQSIVARSVDPLEAAVVSICVFQAGSAHNVIPQTAHLEGTARSFKPAIRDLLEKRLREIVEGTARMHGATARFTYHRDYPVTLNHPAQTEFAARVAADVAGGDNVDRDAEPSLGGEDFAFMLQARPGAFIFMGNGASAGLHHPAYDFADDAIPFGTSYWIRLVEMALPAA